MRALPGGCLLLILTLVRSAPAEAREGTLAVVNLGSAGHELVTRAGEKLHDHLGGWARSGSSIAAYLAGRPNPGPLPAGDVGKELGLLTDRLRSRQASSAEMAALGRLLGVDYLLLMAVRGQGYVARLFSVHRSAYAEGSLDSASGDLDQLRPFLRGQTRPAAPVKRSWKQRWWVLGLIAVVGGVTLGLALANRDDQSGDLRIRVSR